MGLITPGELSLFFSSACFICLMIDNKIFKGEAWSIALFLVFLVPFYNCMFEILFFLLGILSWMFNTIWVFIFAVICDLICWMLLTNLLFIVVLILLCMCISEFCVPISQLLSVSEMTYDNWDHLISEHHVFICISWTNAKIIASVNYIQNILILPHKGKQLVAKNYLQEKITIRFDISASTTSSTNKTIKATRGSGIPAPGSAGTR